MSRLLAVLVAVGLALTATAQTTEQLCRTVAGKQSCLKAEPHTIMVRVKPGLDEMDVMVRLVVDLDANDVHYVATALPRAYTIRSNSLTVQQMYDRLKDDPGLQWVEPNAYREGGIQSTPNDPYFGNAQWQLSNGYGTTGTGYAGECGTPEQYTTGINAPAAWDFSTGSRSVAVMLNDSGWVSHPDLDGNKWSAPTSFTVMVNGSPLTCPAGTNGFDFYTNWPAVSCGATDSSTFSHGTETAGMVGAIGNNGVGVSGVAQQVTLIAMKGVGTLAPIDAQQIAAVDVAFQLNQIFPNLNLRVVNNSWAYASFQVPSQALHDEYALASSRNILLVFAAGNNGVNIDSQPMYPAYWMHDIPAIIAVGGYRCGGTNIYNYGPTTVQIGAPGYAVYSTSNNCSTTNDAGSWRCGPGPSTYAYMGGTSSATPLVSGAAALLWSRCASLDYAGIKAAILNNVTPDPQLTDKYVTGGRLNVGAAMAACVGQTPAREQHAVQVGN